MKTEEWMIISFLIIFLFGFIIYHQLYIKPKEDKEKKDKILFNNFKDEEKKWIELRKNNNNQKLTDELTDLKDMSASKLKYLEYQNFLPSEQEIKLEDSFSDAYNIPKSKEQNLINASVPTLNTYQCWLSREFECPTKNGSYLQCTNNYIPKPNEKNCDCGNRTFEMCPFPYKISENKYYKEIGFNRQKEFGHLII
jgi:hypothetical protein